MEGSKTNYSRLVCRSGDNKYFDFTRFEPLSSVNLKLVNGSIGINFVNLKLKEFKNEIDSLKKKKAKKQSYKITLTYYTNCFEKLIPGPAFHAQD